MDAFQPTAFQNLGFQAGAAGGVDRAFQCGAFQSTGFQTCGGASGYQQAFQCGAFQQTAFQTCVHPAPIAGAGGGGFVKHPYKNPRFAPVELSPTQLIAERVRAGVIPAPVKQVVKRVAKRALADLQKPDDEIERELRIELAQRQITYDRAYARALEQERERQVTAEIKRLMALQSQQREVARMAGIAAQLAELKRQIDEFKRRDEQEIEILLMYS
jgi:hypothetical protein